MSLNMTPVGPWKLENNGTFEGYVGQDPRRVENKKGTSQCWLHVGQTPRFRAKDGEVKKEPTIWIQFTAFNYVAEFILDNIRIGQRVLINYIIQPRYRMGGGTWPAFVILTVRPQAKLTKDDLKGGDDLWLPPKVKGGGAWSKALKSEGEGDGSEAP